MIPRRLQRLTISSMLYLTGSSLTLGCSLSVLASASVVANKRDVVVVVAMMGRVTKADVKRKDDANHISTTTIDAKFNEGMSSKKNLIEIYSQDVGHTVYSKGRTLLLWTGDRGSPFCGRPDKEYLAVTLEP